MILTLAGMAACAGIMMSLLVLARGLWGRRVRLVERISPYVSHSYGSAALAGHSVRATRAGRSRTVGEAIVARLSSWTRVTESLGSSEQSVRRRLQVSASPLSVEQFRIEQLLWAAVGLAGACTLGLAAAWVRPVSVIGLIVLAIVAALSGAAARDWWLSTCVTRRRRRIDAQLPDVIELLALVVGAGLGPVDALERIVSAGRGPLIEELRDTLADIRSGTMLATALDHLDQRVESLPLGRLNEAMRVALERGTPLASVLRAQAADCREAARQSLMEEGGRREIAQMIPVVFLVLPITVVFALFPGLAVIHLGL